MRLPKRRELGTLEFNMTPMIDVTFQLIIFFLVANNMLNQENQVPVSLPKAASGRQPSDELARHVTINILADGQLLLGSQPVDVAELGRRIDFEAGQKGAELEVRIRSDRDVPYRFVEPSMTACAKSGVWKVMFAVTHKES